MKLKSDISRRNRNFREYRPLVPVLAALVAGILCDTFFLTPEKPETVFSSVSVFWFLLTLTAFCLVIFSERFHFRFFTVSQWTLILLLTGTAGSGGLYHHLYWNFYPLTEVGGGIEEPFTLAVLEGKITRPPVFLYPADAMMFSHAEKEDVSTIFQLHVSARYAESNAHSGCGVEPVQNRRLKATGNVVVRTLGRLENVHAGDVVRVSGRLVRPSEAANPGAFSPRLYYRRERILSLLRVPSPENVEIIRRPGIWGMFRTVEFLRSAASERLEKYLTPETKPMAAALILGCRDEVSNEELMQMLETGTIHIMAISGLHVGLLAGGFFIFCRLLGASRTVTVFIVLFCVWLYVLVSGARPPALRAGVIITISTFAYFFSQTHSRLNTLAAAGIIVLILNPTAIFYTGTQLSFLAVGTLLFTPILKDPSSRNQKQKLKQKLKQKQEQNPKKFQEKEVPEMSLSWEYLLIPDAPRKKIILHLLHRAGNGILNLLYSSLIMTAVLLPLVVSAFHVASFIGILLNVLLWPPLMAAMMSGAAVLLFGSVPFLGNLFGWCCSSALLCMNTMIQTAASVPGHCLWLRGTPLFWNFLLYTTVILFCVFPVLRFKKPVRKKYACVFLVLLIALFPFQYLDSARRGDLRCSFISVSHGLAVLIQLPNGKNLLFDAGQFASPEIPARTVSEFLWNSGVHSLDAVVVSHPDMDHYNGIPGILQRFPVRKLYVSPQMYAEMQQIPKKNRIISEKRNTPAPDASSLTQRERILQQVEAETQMMLGNFRDAVEEREIPVETLRAGDRLEPSPGCVLTVLHPSAECLRLAPTHTNGNSLVILLEYEGYRFLLTGDLAPPGLAFFLAQKSVPCDVVQAPHHGGKTCCTPEFEAWCRPKHFVICESFNNEQRRTAEIFREAGAAVHHTGLEGAVIFSIKDGKLECYTREEWKKWH